jgi:hypothetical protein
MKPAHTIDHLSHYIQNNSNLFDSLTIDEIGFRTILSLIFKCNVFKFNDKFFLHQIGIPMGCKCGPSVANLYLFALEKKYLELHPEMKFFRFIDDISIASPTQINKTELCSQFDYLKLNIMEGKVVNFLDLNINHDDFTNKLQFSLYIKPTNNFAYLRTDSNHPSSIFKNIPKSLFIRIRRICSSYTYYLHFSRILIVQLLKRGYNYKLINSVSLSILEK